MGNFCFPPEDRQTAYLFVKLRLEDDKMSCINHHLWCWAAHHWHVRELPFDMKFIGQLFPEFARFVQYKPGSLTGVKRQLIIEHMLEQIETELILG